MMIKSVLLVCTPVSTCIETVRKLLCSCKAINKRVRNRTCKDLLHDSNCVHILLAMVGLLLGHITSLPEFKNCNQLVD